MSTTHEALTSEIQLSPHRLLRESTHASSSAMGLASLAPLHPTRRGTPPIITPPRKRVPSGFQSCKNYVLLISVVSSEQKASRKSSRAQAACDRRWSVEAKTFRHTGQA